MDDPHCMKIIRGVLSIFRVANQSYSCIVIGLINFDEPSDSHQSNRISNLTSIEHTPPLLSRWPPSHTPRALCCVPSHALPSHLCPSARCRRRRRDKMPAPTSRPSARPRRARSRISVTTGVRRARAVTWCSSISWCKDP